MALLLEALLHADEDVLGDSRGDETACRHNVPVPDDGGGLFARDDLPLSPDLGPEFLNDGVLRGRLQIAPGLEPEIFVFLFTHGNPPFQGTTGPRLRLPFPRPIHTGDRDSAFLRWDDRTRVLAG